MTGKNYSGVAKWIVVAAAAAALSVGNAAQKTATDPAHWTDAQKEEFLRTAKVVRRKTLSVGVTGSQRVTLTDGETTHDAHMQTIDEYKREFVSAMGTEINFRDFCLFNVAAYRLDRLMGLNIVPVSIERKVAGRRSALTWWVDDVLMMELDRYKKHIQPPDTAAWNDQMFNVRVFHQLVYNTDANVGNLLITQDWRLWVIDFTRAFRRYKTLADPDRIVRVDRRFYDGLRALTLAKVQEELAKLLGEGEIDGLMARRDEIQKILDERIARDGEAKVICSLPGH